MKKYKYPKLLDSVFYSIQFYAIIYTIYTQLKILFLFSDYLLRAAMREISFISIISHSEKYMTIFQAESSFAQNVKRLSSISDKINDVRVILKGNISV